MSFRKCRERKDIICWDTKSISSRKWPNVIILMILMILKRSFRRQSQMIQRWQACFLMFWPSKGYTEVVQSINNAEDLGQFLQLGFMRRSVKKCYSFIICIIIVWGIIICFIYTKHFHVRLYKWVFSTETSFNILSLNERTAGRVLL